jgi:hypothetical protein
VPFLGEQFDLGPAWREYSAILLNIVNTCWLTRNLLPLRSLLVATGKVAAINTGEVVTPIVSTAQGRKMPNWSKP